MQHSSFRRINYIPSVQKMGAEEGASDEAWMISLKQWRTKVSGSEYLITPARVQQLQGMLVKGPVSRLKNIPHIDGRSGLTVVKQDSILKLPEGRLPSSIKQSREDLVLYKKDIMGSDCAVNYADPYIVNIDFDTSSSPEDPAMYLECLGVVKREGHEGWQKQLVEFLFDGFGRLMGERKLNEEKGVNHDALGEQAVVQPVRVTDAAGKKVLTEVALVDKPDAMMEEGWLRAVYVIPGEIRPYPRQRIDYSKRLVTNLAVYRLTMDGLLINDKQWPPSQRFAVTFRLNVNGPSYTYATPEEGCFTACDDLGNIYFVMDRLNKKASVKDRMELIVESKGGRVVAARHCTLSGDEDHFRMINYDLVIDAYDPNSVDSTDPVGSGGGDADMVCLRCMKPVDTRKNKEKEDGNHGTGREGGGGGGDRADSGVDGRDKNGTTTRTTTYSQVQLQLNGIFHLRHGGPYYVANPMHHTRNYVEFNKKNGMFPDWNLLGQSVMEYSGKGLDLMWRLSSLPREFPEKQKAFKPGEMLMYNPTGITQSRSSPVRNASKEIFYVGVPSREHYDVYAHTEDWVDNNKKFVAFMNKLYTLRFGAVFDRYGQEYSLEDVFFAQDKQGRTYLYAENHGIARKRERLHKMIALYQEEIFDIRDMHQEICNRNKGLDQDGGVQAENQLNKLSKRMEEVSELLEDAKAKRDEMEAKIRNLKHAVELARRDFEEASDIVNTGGGYEEELERAYQAEIALRKAELLAETKIQVAEFVYDRHGGLIAERLQGEMDFKFQTFAPRVLVYSMGAIIQYPVPREVMHGEPGETNGILVRGILYTHRLDKRAPMGKDWFQWYSILIQIRLGFWELFAASEYLVTDAQYYAVDEDNVLYVLFKNQDMSDRGELVEVAFSIKDESMIGFRTPESKWFSKMNYSVQRESRMEWTGRWWVEKQDRVFSLRTWMKSHVSSKPDPKNYIYNVSDSDSSESSANSTHSEETKRQKFRKKVKKEMKEGRKAEARMKRKIEQSLPERNADGQTKTTRKIRKSKQGESDNSVVF